MQRSVFLRRSAFIIAASTIGVGACSGEEVHTVERSLGWQEPSPSPFVFPDHGDEETASTGAETGPPVEGVIPQFVGRAIEVDPPRVSSLYCGDGAWDPETEECDAGPSEWGDARAICSASCQTRDLLVVDPTSETRDQSRRLGLGRHPLALGELSGGLTWVEHGSGEALPDGSGSVPQVVLQTLTLQGGLHERLVIADENQGEHPVLASDPVVAALPTGELAVVYNDLNGDGSELGIALRFAQRDDYLDPNSTWTVTETSYANTTTVGAQSGADLVWTRDGLIGAWVDSSDAGGSRIVTRRLRADGLVAASAERVISALGPAVGGVALTALPLSVFASDDRKWAAVFRSGLDEGAEDLVIYTPEVDGKGQQIILSPAWVDGTVSDLSAAPAEGQLVRPMPGHLEDKPAIAHLSGDRVAVAFSVGTDPEGSGVASVFRIWVAVVDLEFTLIEGVYEIVPQQPGWNEGTRSLREPSLVSTHEGQIYLGFRTEGAQGDARGEELWLKRLDLAVVEGQGALDLSIPEVSFQRNVGHENGDQRRPVLASGYVPGEGTLRTPALALAFEDWALGYSSDQARPDILLQIAPTPLRRGAPIDDQCTSGSCALGEGPCIDNSDCQNGLSCHQDRGPWYGRGHKVAVCEPAHCNDRLLSGNETGVDCGGDCGQCFSCLDPTTYLGTAHFCSLVCPCSPREGDCDQGYECEPGLSCIKDGGALASFPEAIDICDFDHCHDGTLNASEMHRDCGGPDCAECVNGSATHCVDVDCNVGEGDCSAAGANCAEGLVCSTQDAPLFRLNPDVGVCVEATCPEGRGNPYAPDFCSAACQCPGGYGLCDSDAECFDSKCITDRGLYFGLNADDAVCIADHCFDHQQNYDEESIDCGGECGSECPVCDIDPGFRSVEDASLWGYAAFSGGGIVPTNQLVGSSTHSDGALSLAYTDCNFNNVSSVVFDGSQFEIVGDRLRLDARLDIGAGGQSWDWLGNLDVGIQVDGIIYALGTPQTWTRAQAGAWTTLEYAVPGSVQTAFLSGDREIQWRLGFNRSCSAAGASSGALLIDNFRFAGVAVFRSECASDGHDGSGGAGSEAGGGGSGGTSGDSGGGGNGGAGSGGASSGGTGSGGAGGAAATVASEIFGFEQAQQWTPTLTQSSDATEGSFSLSAGAGYQQYTTVGFKAADVAEKGALLVDIKLPARANSSTPVGGQFDVTVSCSSVGLNNVYLGQTQYQNLASGQWSTAALMVPQTIITALATTATDCSLRISSNMWAHITGGRVLIDNLRFVTPTHCAAYQQQNNPPFSLGMPTTPNGTVGAPYRICSASQLQTVANTPSLWSKYFVLEANLDISTLAGQIGNNQTAFSGTFDGQGHVLTGYTRSATTNVGLFGRVTGDGVLNGANDGLIEDLIISDFDITGTSQVGALVGQLTGGVARNIVAEASSVSGSVSRIGGLIGAVIAGQVLDSEVGVTVSAQGTQVGGAVGYSTGLIDGVFSYGTVSVSQATGPAGGLVGELVGGDVIASEAYGAVLSDFDQVGGLVGAATAFSLIEDSWSSGSVTLTNSAEVAGGLIGFLDQSDVFGSRSAGQVSGSAVVGGLIGRLGIDSAVFGCEAQGDVTTLNVGGGLVGEIETSSGSSIEQCGARGNVVAVEDFAGGLIGYAESGSVQDTVALGTVSALGSFAGALLGAAGPLSVVRSYGRGMASAGSDGGAFVGQNLGSLSVSSSFATENNSALPLSGDGALLPGVARLTTAEQTTTSVFQGAGWNFVSVWMMSEQGPKLR